MLNYNEMWHEYISLFETDRKASNEIKHSHIPKKLFKYISLRGDDRDKKLETLKSNQLWVSKATEFNDPFDCNGFFFNEDKLIQTLKIEGFEDRVNFPEIMKNITKHFLTLRRYIQVACFSEDLYNMPMWGNYADNHRGICVEYDFNQISSDNDFTKMLFPVAYEPKRYDLTGMLHKGYLSGFDPLDSNNILFFTMMMKHNSWKYEKEWRFLQPDVTFLNSILTGKDIESDYIDAQKGELVDTPVNPTAIYFGQACSETDIADISSKFMNSETALYRMAIGNEEYFHLNTSNLKEQSL